MRSNVIYAAALARIVVAAPAPQQFDFAAVLTAAAPSVTAPPIGAVNQTTYSVDTASIAASISSDVTTAASASVTGSSASAAATESPSSTALDKRTNQKTTSKTSSWSSSSSLSLSSSSSSITTSTSIIQQSSTSTTSSSTACPTTPEAGTYCGFINPEDACAPQPGGYGPQVNNPDTVAAFEAYPEFHQDAENAKTPFNYTNVFKDLNASTSANSYLTFYTLESYDVSGCANYCETTDLCTAFNIYIERDPSLNPTTNATNNATNCPNPASITNYKCSLWGSSIDASSATNSGDYRDEFQVVIVASNGYDKTNNTTPPSLPGWSSPSNCSDGGISAGGSYWMGSQFYPGPFDPSICGIYAQAQTATNKKVSSQKGASSYTPANMFNAYMVHLNGVPQGTYCALFDTVLSLAWAGFKGTSSGNNYFGVQSSWTYALGEQDDGKF